MPLAGRLTAPARHTSTRTSILLAAALLSLAVLAVGLLRAGSAGAETTSYLPASASCSNSPETDETPAVCSASAGTLAPGGGVAIVENDDDGPTRGDDDLQAVFNLNGLDASRITGANLQVGSAPNGTGGTIQLGGPSISATNYGSVPATGGSTSSGALVSAVTNNAGGSLTVWLQVACNTPNDDCGAAVDSLRLNVELEDPPAPPPAAASLLVSSSANRSGGQSLAGANLEGNAFIFLTSSDPISQVRFFLDDPGRNSADSVENSSPYDFQGGDGNANPWNADGVADGAHTMHVEVDFTSGASTVVSANFTTGSPPPPPPSGPTLMVSASANRANSVPLDGTSFSQDVYIHISQASGIQRVRFFLDDPGRNSSDRTENVNPYDFGGTLPNGNAGAWDPGSVSTGGHTMHAEVDLTNGSTVVVNASFTTTGGSPPPTPTPSPTPSPTPTPPPANYDVYVSENSNRSNAAVLNGQTFDGDIYVFVAIPNGINQARFWVDDRNRTGGVDHVENVVPFDLVGGSTSNAVAFDAGALNEGTHWITVEIDVSGAGTQVVEGSFKVPAGGGGGGPPIPPGAIRISPGQSIQGAVNANPNGTTFVIGSGVHRMQTVVAKSGNTFIGEPGAILNGSRVLTGWNSAGSGQYWVGNQTQQVNPKGTCVTAGCQYPEQVFVNGTSLRQVLSRSALDGNSFYFDYGANRIYIEQNPSGKFIEASVTERAFNRGGTSVTVSGLIVEKYSTRAQDGAIHAAGNWTVTNNESRFNHGSGIRVTTGDRILDNYVHHNGQLGIGGSGSNILVQGNEVAYNNTAGFLVPWEAGGVKFALLRDTTFRDNYVHHNDGHGIWTDQDSIDTLVEDNVVEWNERNGIKHEIDFGAITRNNLVRFNGLANDNWMWGAQIMIQNGSNAEVYGNEVWVAAAGGDGITIVEQNRGSGRFGPRLARNNSVHHNEIHHLSTRGSNGMTSQCSPGTNLFNFNTYYAPEQYFNQKLNGFVACPYVTWQQFRAAGHEANGTRINTN